MTSGSSNLRIHGLVSLMRRVRDRLSVGVQGGEARQLRSLVREGVQTVDRICREHGITPQQLPAPSRRAYDYLSALDLTRLPKPGERDTPRESAPDEDLRITGILATCRRYHRRFETLAKSRTGPFSPDDAAIQALSADLSTESDAIAALSEDAGTTAGALPVRSRRGYQWLTFLGAPDHLAQHLNALVTLMREGERVRNDRRSAPAQVTIHYEVFATSVLYRTQSRPNALHILINEGFIAAPESVLQGLVQAGLGLDPDQSARTVIKHFAASKAFADLQKAVYQTASSPPEAARGRAHDLQAVFERVNTAYFGGRAARPTLEWGRMRTYRKLGHYDDARDIVMVSPTLDDPAVPEYVIDFVVYHELLHKQLGIAMRNGRRHAHTTEFRNHERAFKHYRQARAFLAHLAKT